jgi:hypothetical protein
MPYRPITIDALQIGMHVAKLDVAWFRSPFMRHSFLIRTDEQIEKLRRAGVKHLSIDPARGWISQARHVGRLQTATQRRWCSPRPHPEYAGSALPRRDDAGTADGQSGSCPARSVGADHLLAHCQNRHRRSGGSHAHRACDQRRRPSAQQPCPFHGVQPRGARAMRRSASMPLPPAAFR